MSSQYTLNRSRCNGCVQEVSNKIIKLDILNQRITKSVGQSESQYLGNLEIPQAINSKFHQGPQAFPPGKSHPWPNLKFKSRPQLQNFTRHAKP